MTIVLVFSLINEMRYFCNSVLPLPVIPPITIETFESINICKSSITLLSKELSSLNLKEEEAIRKEKLVLSSFFLRATL